MLTSGDMLTPGFILHRFAFKEAAVSRPTMVVNYFEAAEKYPWFTKSEIAIFIDGFKKFDTDNSGSIDINELEVALKSIGMVGLRYLPCLITRAILGWKYKI